jgi:alanine racemase
VTKLGREAEDAIGTVTRVAAMLRPAWVEVDLAAVTSNVAYIARVVAPARVCAVVKADGYGHGAVPVARAAVAGGAVYLAVAAAEEGHELRRAGIGTPILILSEPSSAAMPLVVADGLTPTLYTETGLAALIAATTGPPAGGAGSSRHRVPVPVHLKFDSGMHRVGADRETVLRIAQAVMAAPALHLEGLFTHLAVADEPDDPFTAKQVAAFEDVVTALADHGIEVPMRHAANSAGALWHPRARLGMVRPGIAIYGLPPATRLRAHPAVLSLRPALALKARVSFVKEVPAGEGVSYGLRYHLSDRSIVATVPVGYGDGVPRRLSDVGGQVLIGARRRPIAGTVTMDQLMVDCGPGADVRPGDEVVLLGRQGEDEVSAWEWADRLGTIAYEVTCGLSPRLPRNYV